MTIKYSADEMTGWIGLLRLFLRIRGTIFAGAFTGPIFWLAMCAHVAVLIVNDKIPILVPDPDYEAPSGDASSGDETVPYVHYFTAGTLPRMPWSVGVMSLSLLFFFAVFYSNNCYQRFTVLFGHTVGLGGTTMEWTLLVKNYTPTLAKTLPAGITREEELSALKAKQWNAMRFVLTTMHLLYYTLYGSDDGVGLSTDEWDMMIARNLITETEAEKLAKYAGFKPLVALVWALDEAKNLVGEWSQAETARHRDLGQGMRDEVILQQFREVAFKFRGHCGQIVNLLSQPIPFPYFHLLHVIMLCQLLLLAYTLGTYDGLEFYLAIPSMGIITTILIGLRSLAAQLSNPFGDDLTDFPLEAFMVGAFKNSKALLMEAPHELGREDAGRHGESTGAGQGDDHRHQTWKAARQKQGRVLGPQAVGDQVEAAQEGRRSCQGRRTRAGAPLWPARSACRRRRWAQTTTTSRMARITTRRALTPDVRPCDVTMRVRASMGIHRARMIGN